MQGAISLVILEKLNEQVERIEHLMQLVPADRIDWSPQIPEMGGKAPANFSRLLGHLLDCVAGFCATLFATNGGSRLPHWETLRDLPVNHCCGIEEARERLALYMRHIQEGFSALSDEDLSRRISTVFVPEGEPVATLLLGNLEHLINHKYQLFFYLKMLGLPVSSPDLYRFRGNFEVGAAR